MMDEKIEYAYKFFILLRAKVNLKTKIVKWHTGSHWKKDYLDSDEWDGFIKKHLYDG